MFIYYCFALGAVFYTFNKIKQFFSLPRPMNPRSRLYAKTLIFLIDNTVLQNRRVVVHAWLLRNVKCVENMGATTRTVTL